MKKLLCLFLFVSMHYALLAGPSFWPVISNQSEAPAVSVLRPRLYVRADDAAIGRGLTLSALKARSNNSAYSDWVDFDGELQGWASLPAAAMQHLLKPDKQKAMIIAEYIVKTPFTYNEHTSAAAMVYHTAIAFDWIRDAIPDEMALQICAKLVEGAEHLREGVVHPSINHNYSMVSLYGLTTVAVAIYGEGKVYTQKSSEYLEIIDETLTKENFLLETFQNKRGSWGEGNHYTPYVVFYPFLMSLRALATGTDADYFALIRNEYGNFLEPMAKFLIANFRPDFTLERIGDILERVVPVNTFMRPLLELLASEVRDPVLQGQVHSFSQAMTDHFKIDIVPDLYSWMMMVIYDSKLPETPSYKTLPLAMRFGENSYEHIMFKNSWESDGTQITYISGDHYTDHQHFDKGHFLIYKKGGLVIDGGGYGNPMYGDNWSNYSTRTLAHNSVLIYDSTEHPYAGISGTTIYPDGGQKVLRRVQNARDWADYLENKQLNTADVIAYDVDEASNRYNYVKTNLTNAYDSTTVWIDRQLLYLPLADYLLVKDRVITAKPLKKYWLLHFEQTPSIDGNKPDAGVHDYKGSAILRSDRTDRAEFGGASIQNSGRLFIKSLLPEDRMISVIGGKGYEFYNSFFDKNFPNRKPFSPIIEPGNWRMQEYTSKPSSATAFLHALHITDVSEDEMVHTEYIETRDKKMDGVVFLSKDRPYAVLFSTSMDGRGDTFQRIRFPVQYKFRASAGTTHVLVELEPHRRVTVYVNRKRVGIFETSGAGVLVFEDATKGMRSVRIETD